MTTIYLVVKSWQGNYDLEPTRKTIKAFFLEESAKAYRQKREDRELDLRKRWKSAREEFWAFQQGNVAFKRAGYNEGLDMFKLAGDKMRELEEKYGLAPKSFSSYSITCTEERTIWYSPKKRELEFEIEELEVE